MHLDVVMRCLKTLEPRGPEETRSLYLNGVGYLGFTRLALNGLTENGMQPMHREKLTWVCNGEIYNWKELAAQYNITTVSGSDCEVLGPLYEKFCELEIPLEEFLGRSVFTGNPLENPQERLIHILKGFVPPVQMGDRLIGSEGDAAKNAWLSFVGSPVRTYQTKEK